MADVPAAMNTSQVHAVDAAVRSAGDSDSPNQTTPGRASPPHPGHVAGCAGSGTRSSRHGKVPQRFQQESSQIEPCSRTRRCVPARMCRSSTFCVMTVHVFESRVHCASTSCAAFGWHDAIVARRHSYHSHTSAGSRANASGVARSSTRNDRHSPPAPRNVGTPLAADTPAPVSTVTRRASFRRAASFSSKRSF